MGIFSKENTEAAKEKAGKAGAEFFSEPGSYVVELVKSYHGKIKNPKNANAGQEFAAITFKVVEAFSGPCIPGDERKLYYGLGFPGSESIRHQIAMRTVLEDVSSCLGISVVDLNETILDGFFEDDGAAFKGSKVKIDVTNVEKNGKTYTNHRTRSVEPAIDPSEVLAAASEG